MTNQGNRVPPVPSARTTTLTRTSELTAGLGRVLCKLKFIARRVLKCGDAAAPELDLGRSCEANPQRTQALVFAFDIGDSKGYARKPAYERLLFDWGFGGQDFHNDEYSAALEATIAKFRTVVGEPKSENLRIKGLGRSNLANKQAYG